MGDSRDRLNLDDTAPGVLDRVRPPRLGRPYSRTGKLCSAQLSPEATIPGISTIPCFAFELAASRESWEAVAIETLCSATLPLDQLFLSSCSSLSCPWLPPFILGFCAGTVHSKCSIDPIQELIPDGALLRSQSALVITSTSRRLPL